MIRRSLTRKWLLRAVAACACLAAAPAAAAAGGGAAYSPAAPAPAPTPTVPAVTTPATPTPKAQVLPDGTAVPPAGAPARVQRVILAGNKLIGKPYRYGGGHRAFTSQLDSGYDCSGTVSFALAGGAFLKSPLPSGPLMRWGVSGPGRWLTVYAHGGHAFLVVAGLRLDTGYRDKTAPTRSGPAWSKRMRPSTGFTPRHPGNF
jgi:cell wall-associated NlpC family hydrolase